MVLDHAFPPDLRVENEARTLVDAGFEVTILAIGPDDRPAADWMDGVRIIRDNVPKRIRNWMRGLSGTMALPSRLLARRILRVHRAWPFDVLHLHDLYLFGGGIRAAARLGVPLVGDLHENWVEALKHYSWSSSFPGNVVVSIPGWERLEREWVTQMDRLIVVVGEAAERNRRLGVPPERIVEVPNTIRMDDFSSYPVDQRLLGEIRGPLTVVYTGGMDIHRGLDRVIDAMREVVVHRPEARLWLVGDGRIRPDLEAQARAAGLEEQVVFPGWQPQPLIRTYIEAADICLVPHRRTVHTDATLPHKLFHYMYAEKPVIVTDCKPLDRIVSEERCGLVVPDGQPEAMARAILELANRPGEREAMGRRGRGAVEARWNWAMTSRAMLDMYRQLEARGPDG
jgi:glycosyltransferase involved in cell wall biosynthesis